MLEQTKSEFIKIKETYAPYITEEKFMYVYKRWKNDSRKLEFIRYLQTRLELNEIEPSPIHLERI